MDSETRHLNAGDAARAPGQEVPAPAPPAPTLAPTIGTPTTYLPANGAPPAGNGAPYPPQAAGPAPAPAQPNFGTTYVAPPSGPAAGPPPAGGTYSTPGAGPGNPWASSWRGPRAGRNMWLPLALIAFGLFALSGRFHAVFGAAIPLALGLIFLYVSTQGPHRWGFRIPGALLTGLGAGIVLETMDLGGGGYSAVGLGLGFVALWLWDRTQWWWLIPGAVVTLGGLEGVMSSSGWHGGWILPLALIAFGAYALSGRRWRTRP